MCYAFVNLPRLVRKTWHLNQSFLCHVRYAHHKNTLFNAAITLLLRVMKILHSLWCGLCVWKFKYCKCTCIHIWVLWIACTYPSNVGPMAFACWAMIVCVMFSKCLNDTCNAFRVHAWLFLLWNGILTSAMQTTFDCNWRCSFYFQFQKKKSMYYVAVMGDGSTMIAQG